VTLVVVETVFQMFSAGVFGADDGFCTSFCSSLEAGIG
jgi:hypothetical protein